LGSGGSNKLLGRNEKLLLYVSTVGQNSTPNITTMVVPFAAPAA
jgi:hypothetical protein